MTMTLISLLFLLIDQISKIIVVKSLASNYSLPIIKNFFYLTYTHNEGAAWSILEGQRLFLIMTAILVIAAIIYYLRKNKINSKLETLAFSLVIGGSLGNLLDRVVRSHVVDFLDFKIFGYNFPIFNLADIFIVVGVFLLIIITYRKEDKNVNRSK